MQIKLSKRLETIVEMVPVTGDDSCVADIGTDHGFVPIRLMELKSGTGTCNGCEKGTASARAGACSYMWDAGSD
ncbi:MAG: SAM-dependent methyltransferase [Lachnospiraceae bacterium]